MLARELADLYTRDLTRLIQQLSAFPDTATLWQTRSGITNSAGNLALHLEGNLREFIGRLLGHLDYQRDRPREFSDSGVEKAELIMRLTAVRDEIPQVIAGLTAEQLDADFPQVYGGRTLPNRQMLIHLEGHLSYHLGQIDYLRRVLTGDGAITLADL
ncbi:MAG: DinB family protein [Acidobacteriota bacterium]|nr:DinB family protein [Acidobacteriota bacterium]